MFFIFVNNAVNYIVTFMRIRTIDWKYCGVIFTRNIFYNVDIEVTECVRYF